MGPLKSSTRATKNIIPSATATASHATTPRSLTFESVVLASRRGSGGLLELTAPA
jgi:hypothetical protein